MFGVGLLPFAIEYVVSINALLMAMGAALFIHLMSQQRGVTVETIEPKVLEALQEAVDRANEAVSKAESIRKFAVLPGDFTEANGYLTPSLKLKRNVVMKDYADEVEKLYA